MKKKEEEDEEAEAETEKKRKEKNENIRKEKKRKEKKIKEKKRKKREGNYKVTTVGWNEQLPLDSSMRRDVFEMVPEDCRTNFFWMKPKKAGLPKE